MQDTYLTVFDKSRIWKPNIAEAYVLSTEA
jgi:hypothetical protein